MAGLKAREEFLFRLLSIFSPSDLEQFSAVQLFGGLAANPWSSRQNCLLLLSVSPTTQGNLDFQFLLRQGRARVILDEREDRIHFFNCHVPFGLRTSAAGGFSCTTNAIIRVHDARVANLGRCLTIVTRTGKCVVPRGDSDYSSLYQRLKLVVPDNHPGYLIHDPRMQYPIGAAISGSGVLGLLAGCWMTPMGANDTMLYFFGALIATVVCVALSGWFGCQASLSARPVARLIGVVIAALMTSRGLTTVTFARARVTPV